MNEKVLEAIQNTIDYSFNNDDLLQQAFIRRSYSEENGGENNEVLEFIGDKALDLVVIKVMMKRFGNITEGDYQEFKTKYTEGKFTTIKEELVKGKMLAKCIDKLGFNNYLILGKGDAKKNVQEEDSVKEDLFEAIVGAVAIDSDWDLDAIEEVANTMLNFNEFFNNNLYDNEIDYVKEVQEWFQKNKGELPNYVFETEDEGFSCHIDVPELSRWGFTGFGKSKSGARFLAAKELYEYLEDNDLLITMVDEVGEPDYDRAINQLQELYQKGYIDEPIYDFYEDVDRNGNVVWTCECRTAGMKGYYSNEATSKKEAKKLSAYELLCDILGVKGE